MRDTGDRLHLRPREPETTAFHKVLQQNLLTFEQEWTDKSDGRTLPSFVTDELRDFLDCGHCRRTVKKILSAMGLPTEAPKLYPARPPPAESGGEGGDRLN
jgi:hypothetical protein